MLAQYVMKSIDSLFSDKLYSENSSQLCKNKAISSTNAQNGSNFNKNTIKSKLDYVIKKEDKRRSTAKDKEKSLSPIQKSKLKTLLQENRQQTIRTVLRSKSNKKEMNPDQKIELQKLKHNQTKNLNKIPPNITQKQNNIVHFYREQRKSIDKQGKIVKRSKKTFNHSSQIKASMFHSGTSNHFFRDNL